LRKTIKALLHPHQFLPPVAPPTAVAIATQNWGHCENRWRLNLAWTCTHACTSWTWHPWQICVGFTKNGHVAYMVARTLRTQVSGSQSVKSFNEKHNVVLSR
jgi:hypothetical protein